MKNEKRNVPGCSGYKVDRKGNVYGLDGQKMSPFVDRSGAARVNLRINGQFGVTHYVVRMVCAAFHDSVVSGRDIAVRHHRYRSKKINHANRLRWGTQADVKKKKNRRRLSDSQKFQIASLSKRGVVQHDIATRIGTSQPNVCNTLKRLRDLGKINAKKR